MSAKHPIPGYVTIDALTVHYGVCAAYELMREYGRKRYGAWYMAEAVWERVLGERR
jgi:hypothetical protein